MSKSVIIKSVVKEIKIKKLYKIMRKERTLYKMSNLATKQDETVNVNYAPVSNVVGLVPDTPHNRINNFLTEYDSKNTRRNYARYYKDMFMYMTGKTIEQLTYQDIQVIDKDRVKQYRIFLKEKMKASTINQIIGGACKALWDEFKESNIVDGNPFDLKPLKQTENNYGSLTLEEINNLYDYCLKQKHKPMTQKLFFEFLFVVTCRKHVAQTLTWSQINRELDLETKQMIWVISFTEEFADKGKNIKKSITDEFYQLLRENYEIENEQDKSDKVFCRVDDKTYQATLKGFLKEYNIDPKRNITIHSLKGSGLDFIQNVIGDINVTALAAQHSSIQTTFDRYLNKNHSFSSQPSYMLHKDFSIDMLRELDKEELLSLIEKSGKEVLVKLCFELEKSRE